MASAPHVTDLLLESFDEVAHWDQNVVAWLELQKARYTGCNARGMMLGRDKALTKKLLAFEGVRYGWSNEGGQTVLEIQGDVVNSSSSPVAVPQVVIALRDEKGNEISEWTTETGADELAAGEHAAFLRQIPSPPSNVRSVKVRFAKAK